MGDVRIFELMISLAGSSKTLNDPFQVSSKDLMHNAKILDLHGSRKEFAKIYTRVKYCYKYTLKIFRF